MKRISIIVAAAITLTACSSDNDTSIDEPVAVHVSASIGNAPESRASNVSWDAGDAIGITMDDRYVNLKYVTRDGGSAGLFEGSVMYFKNKRVPVTLAAYYPYSGQEGTGAGIIEVSTTADKQTEELQPSFDFLYDQKLNVIGEDDPNVKFTFSHKMSKLSLKFFNSTGADGIKIVSYTVDGLILDGSFDTASGECAAKADGSAAPLTMELAGDTHDVQQLPLILFPQPTAGRNVTLTITDSDGQVYSCPLTFDQDCLASGFDYRFKINVRKTGLEIGDSDIKDWTTKDESADAGSVNPKK